MAAWSAAVHWRAFPGFVAISCVFILLLSSTDGQSGRRLSLLVDEAAEEHGAKDERQTKHHDDVATPPLHDLGETGDHGDGKHVIDVDQFAFSIMFIGVTVSIIALVYLANNPDQDVRAAMWQMLSNGITIFLAVLLFWSVETVCDRVFGKSLVVNLVLVIIFVLLLQLGLLGASRIDGPPLHDCERAVIACQTFGGLLAHITGFAWLKFWLEVQLQIYHEDHYKWAVVLVFFVAWGVHMLMMLACFKCRQVVVNAAKDQSSGNVDDERRQQEHRWQEEAAEGMLEAGALMLSFIAMQLLKLAITGHLPDPELSKADVKHHPTPLQIVLMLVVTFVLPLLIIWGNCACGSDDVEDQRGIVHSLGKRWLRLRCFQLMGKCLCFLSALALLCSVEWICEALLHRVGTFGRRYLVETIVALVATSLAYTLIWCIGVVDEYLADAKSFAGLEAAEDLLVTAGFMAGFAWEHVFHEAVEATSEFLSEQLGHTYHSPFAGWGDVVLALALLAFLLPSQYWHINPQARRSQARARQYFRKFFEEEGEEEEEEEGEDTEGMSLDS